MLSFISIQVYRTLRSFMDYCGKFGLSYSYTSGYFLCSSYYQSICFAPTTVHWAFVLHILTYFLAEYRAMAVTTSEIVWLPWLLADMGVHISCSTPLHYDNRKAIQIAHNLVFHERTKHIEIDYHFTRHHLQAGTISLSFVPSTLQITLRWDVGV
ncbi:hypothetical protein Tco_0387082 [Tanacetum coccineum]